MKNKLRSAFNTRQYMLSKDFEVYYYSDLHFESAGPHSHTYYEVYFFAEGAVEMEIAGRRYPLSPGDVIVVPPGVEHRAVILDGDQPYRRFVFWLGREYCGDLLRQSPDYMYLFQRAATEQRYVYSFDRVTFNTLRGKLFTLLDEVHAGRYGRDAKITLAVSDLVLDLNRAVYEREHPGGGREGGSVYEALTAYIDGHLEEELSLDRLAREFYLSKYYLAHLFQDNTGLSLHQYITKKRLAAAADAIRGGAAVTAAYSACGFGEYSSFYRAFRKEYGMSPREYATCYAAGEEQ